MPSKGSAERTADGSPAPAVVHPDARIPALDGVRGLAIALVMAYHFVFVSGAWNSSSGGDRVLWRFFGAGWSGVDLFFVLSGFLITGILYDAKSAVGPYFRPFYARRILRIFPLYYLVLFLLVVGLPLVDADAKHAATAIRDGLPWYGTYTTNIWTVFDSSLKAQDLFASHLWSLAVEEQFYLVWPFVVLLLHRRALMGVCVAAIFGAFWIRIGLVNAGSGVSIPYVLTPARMDTLAVGALIALAARDPNDLRLLARWLRPMSVVGIVVVVAIAIGKGDISPPFDTWVVTAGFSAVAFVYGGLLLAVLTWSPSTALHRCFAHPALMALGRYSYAIYLVHLPIASIVVQRTDLVDRIPDVWGASWPGIFVYCAIVAALSFIAGWLSWNLFERHVLKLKDKFPYHRLSA